MDGTPKNISAWGSNNREWKLTALAKSCMQLQLTHTLYYGQFDTSHNNQWPHFEREDLPPSSAIESLGEVEVPRMRSESEQMDRVAEIDQTWRDKQPTIEREKVLMAGYASHVLGTRMPVHTINRRSPNKEMCPLQYIDI